MRNYSNILPTEPKLVSRKKHIPRMPFLAITTNHNQVSRLHPDLFTYSTKKPALGGFYLLAGDGGLLDPSLGLALAGPASRSSAVRIRFLRLRRTSVEVLTLHPDIFTRATKKPALGGFYLLAGDGGFEPPHTESESVVLPLDESPITLLSRNRCFNSPDSDWHRAGDRKINAWSTEDACGPCAGRLSYALQHGRRGSESQHVA